MFVTHPQADSSFVLIAEVLTQISDSEVEVYWIAKGFFALSRDIVSDFAKLRELTYELLQKQDKTLYQYVSEAKSRSDFVDNNYI